MPDKPKYDLEERTLAFSKGVIQFVNSSPKTIANIELSKQVIRSAGSVGANYIEANESLGKKDFLMHVRIAKKEAKETGYWLKQFELPTNLEDRRLALIQESIELMKILGAIERNSIH